MSLLDPSHPTPVVVVGSANIDLLVRVGSHPAPGETLLATGLTRNPGGKGANQAVAAARLGAAVTFVGAVGKDAEGRAIVAALDSEGVTTAVQQLSGVPSGLAVVTIDDAGENSIIVVAGANGQLSGAEAGAAARGALGSGGVVSRSVDSGGVDSGSLDSGSGVARSVDSDGVDSGSGDARSVGSGSAVSDGVVARSLGSGSVDSRAVGARSVDAAPGLSAGVVVVQGELAREATLAGLAAAREAGARAIVNLAPFWPADSATLEQADPLVVNETEAGQLLGRELGDGAGAALAAAEHLTAMSRSVVITLGAAGAVWAAASGSGEVAAAAAPAVVDTTGAGDAFVGALAAALAGGAGLSDAVERGVRAGTFAVGGLGAQTSYPRPGDLALRPDGLAGRPDGVAPRPGDLAARPDDIATRPDDIA